MGTRGIMGFAVDGQVKTQYNQYDTYPDGLGVTMLNFIQTVPIELIREKARALRVVNGEGRPTPVDVRQFERYANLGVSEQSPYDWYCLLRGCQGNPQLVLESGVILDAGEFPYDSLFCEWGYILNLDRDVFEVYEGFQTERHNAGRFAVPLPTNKGSHSGKSYYPIKLIQEFTFDQAKLLTSEEFVRQVTQVTRYKE